MRRFAAIILMLVWLPAAGQLDSLVVGVSELDTLLSDTIECYPYGCPVQKAHGYELPYAFAGVIDVGGTLGATVELSFVTGYDSMHFDTCVVLSPFAGLEYRVFFTILADCQLLIAGPEGCEVHVTVKMDTSNVHHHLPATQFLLSALCPTGITPARETTKHYLRFDTGLLESPPLRRGMYFELDEGYRPTHRKIIVVD